MWELLFVIVLPFFIMGSPNYTTENLELIVKTHSPSLVKYTTYSDSIIMHFNIPTYTIFASLELQATVEDISIFGCNVRNVSVYLKQGGPPVINPDGAPFPEEFRDINRPKIYYVDFLTNNEKNYINISSPDPGIYYALAFLAYEDPRYEKISQQGLTPSCETHVDVAVYISKISVPTGVIENEYFDLIGNNESSSYFVFFIPPGKDHVIIDIEIDKFITGLVRVEARKPPTETVYLIEKSLKSAKTQFIIGCEPNQWYYFEFYIPHEESLGRFLIKYYAEHSEDFVTQQFGNLTLFNMSVMHKTYHTHNLVEIQHYKEYNLVKESTAETYTYSYKLSSELDNKFFVPSALNISTEEFIVLKFHLQQSVDIGGTLQYTLAFKPRIQRFSQDRNIIKLTGEPDGNILLGCLQRGSVAVPKWPNHCYNNEKKKNTKAPIRLNSTQSNSTLLIPYPEGGTWYASFKLFCGKCTQCQCPYECLNEYEMCIIKCELNCTTFCETCITGCKTRVLKPPNCKFDCNCDGACLRNSTAIRNCNSSIVFDLSSKQCYYGSCGRQGSCRLAISEGVAYSSCVCTNNYRGFDCSDPSLANPYYLVLIEFLLLILSNIFFIPVTYLAYKRHYYIEALSYFSIFLSSSFYHACDAGENILTFCVFRSINALQFADFYSALLAIWLTLLAIADLPPVHLSLLQMAGAMIIAFSVTLNRYAFWIFALPSTIGIVIILTSWYLKFRQYRCRFIDKRYLFVKIPIGISVVIIGLIIYGLLQTQSNYKYLHSLWHIIMAIGVSLLLPKENTFQATVLLS